jgi:hypothetical protein
MKSAAGWMMDRIGDALVIVAVIWVLLLIGAASFGV